MLFEVGPKPPKIYSRTPDDLMHYDFGFTREEVGYIEQWAYEYSQNQIVSLDFAYHIYTYAALYTGSSDREVIESFLIRERL